MGRVTGRQVYVWPDAAKTVEPDILTDDLDGLVYSSAYHGGFRDATITVGRRYEDAWDYLSVENRVRGRFFYHVEVRRGRVLLWEGLVRVIDAHPNQAAGWTLHCSGYWWAMRNELYDDQDGGGITDWEAAGSGTWKDIIAEMLTEKCPLISSDQSNLTTPDVNAFGTQGLHTRDYPAVHILDRAQMTMADGTPLYFGVWDDQKAHLVQRSTSKVHWTTLRTELGAGSSLRQDATYWRNSVLPIVGTTEGTASAASRATGVPLREMQFTTPAGTPTATANAERDRILADRDKPQQTAQFVISGRFWDGNGRLAQKEDVRAGQIIRIPDLVPSSYVQDQVTQDNLTTFYIIEARYDANSDVLTVVPDRPQDRVTSVLARQGAIER